MCVIIAPFSTQNYRDAINGHCFTFLNVRIHFLGGGDGVDCIIKYVCQHVTQKLSLLGVHFHN